MKPDNTKPEGSKNRPQSQDPENDGPKHPSASKGPPAERAGLGAILRHEGRWAALLAGLATAIHLLIQLDETAERTWVYPENHFIQISFGFQATAASLLGLLAALSDDLLHTREYLAHRPISRTRLFWVRHGLGLAAITVWLLAVPTLHLLLTLWLSDEAAIVQTSHWGTLVLQDMVAYLFYGLAVFTATVTRRLTHAIALAALAASGAALFGGMSLMLAPVNYRGLVGALSLILTPLLLMAAQTCWLDGRDQDRPWSTRRLALAGPALLFIGGVSAALGCTFLFASAYEGLLDEYPNVASNGREYALGSWSDEAHAIRRLGADHRFSGEMLPEGWDVVWSPAGGRFETAFQTAKIGMGVAQRWVFADPERRLTGYLASGGPMTLFRAARFDGTGSDRPWRRRLGKLGTGPGLSSGFSWEAKPLNPRYTPLLALYDPVDDGIWLWNGDPQAAGFERQPLPQGDRFQAWVADPDLTAWFQPRTRRDYTLLVRGERGIYAWDDTRFVPAAPHQIPPSEANTLDAGKETVGVFGLRAVVKKPGAAETFQHEYQPRKLDERALALVAQGATVLRPPLSAVPSLWASPERVSVLGPRLLLDPGVTLGLRGALVLNLALAFGLGALAFRRLQRLGASPRRRFFWASAVLLGGPAAYLVHRAVETNRAWKPLPAEATQPAPLLLAGPLRAA